MSSKNPTVPDAFEALVASVQTSSPPIAFGGGTIERQSISEQVATRIIDMIRSGNLKTGDRLPTELQMCVAFGISRPPLREALKALTIMGLLESRQGGRYTVTQPSTEQLATSFSLSFSKPEVDFHQHFEARRAVELQSVRLCTERATREQRARILKLATDGRAFYEHPAAFRLLDIEFHDAINAGAHNPLLSTMGRFLYDVGLDVRRVASTIPGVIESSVGQHIEVADAIGAGDPDRAEDALRRHLEHVRDTAIQSAQLNQPVEIE
jgi:GntR family transcriptional repressor for pyruvate dehydrogenase complex